MRQLDKIYAEARKEISKKWADYFGKAQKSIQSTEDELQAAKKKGDSEEVARLEKELINQKQNLTINNDRYEGLVRETTARITDANKAAMNYANAQAVSNYIDGYNAEYQELKDAGIRFDMIDKNTVERRVKDGDIHLPQKQIDEKKDRRWNTKVINREVTQGIIQGESMDKIADRIFPEIAKGTDMSDLDVVKKNLQSSERTARTLVNAAENEGRYDRAVEMEEDGIITKKIWSATGDDRTRDLHLELDGQEVDVDEPFVDGDGNEMMFPGDSLHGADPGTLYNCRCSYETKVIGFRREDGSIAYVDDRNFSREAHEWQIQQEKDRRAEEKESEYEGEAEEREPSFIESLIDKEYSPHISEYTDYEEYRQAVNEWEGKRTPYVNSMDTRIDGGNFAAESVWQGGTTKAPQIEGTFVELNKEYPLASIGEGVEIGLSVTELTVCDYNRVWEYLPAGKDDHRLSHEGDAAAQVFFVQKNSLGDKKIEWQVVVGYNRPCVISTISEDLATRESVLGGGGYLSSVGYSPEALTTHEYGHIVSEHIGNALVHEDETALEYYNWYRSLSEEEKRMGLSDYATTNRDEFEAECFAELHMPNPRPIALKYKEYLDDAISKGY